MDARKTRGQGSGVGFPLTPPTRPVLRSPARCAGSQGLGSTTRRWGARRPFARLCLIAAVAAGTAPDLFNSDGPWLPEFATMGLLDKMPREEFPRVGEYLERLRGGSSDRAIRPRTRVAQASQRE